MDKERRDVKNAKADAEAVEWTIDAKDLSIGVDVELVPLAHDDRVYYIRLNQCNVYYKAEWSTALINATKEEYNTLEKFRESRECSENTLADECLGDVMCTIADSYGMSAPSGSKSATQLPNSCARERATSWT